MEKFFQELGLTLAYGVNIFFDKCIMEAGFPFEDKMSDENKPIVLTSKEPRQKRYAPCSI